MTIVCIVFQDFPSLPPHEIIFLRTSRDYRTCETPVLSPPFAESASLVTPSRYQRRTSATLGFNFSLQWTFGAFDDYVNANPLQLPLIPFSVSFNPGGCREELISAPLFQKSPWRHFPYHCSRLLSLSLLFFSAILSSFWWRSSF